MHSHHRSRHASHVARLFSIGPHPWKVVVVLVAFASACASLTFNPSRVAADSRIQHGVGASGMQVTNLAPEPRAMNFSADYYRQDGFSPITMVQSGIPWPGSWNVYLPSNPDIEFGVYDAIISSDRRHRSGVRIDWLWSGGAANLSRTIDLAHDPAFDDLLDGRPGGFVGSARIRSTGALVTAHVLTEGEPSSNGVYDYPVEPVSDHNRMLHIPRFRVAEPGLGGSVGTRSTSVAVGNPSDTPIEVVVTYSGTDGVCTGRTVETGPHPIPPWSSTILDSALDSGLGSGCAGYAMLTSDGPATAVIVDRTVRSDRPVAYSAHPALTDEDASTLVVVPLARNRFLAGYEVTTETVVTNPGDDPANVTLGPSDETGVSLPGPCDVCSFSLAPHESRHFEAAELGFPVGSYGSILVRSDQPVAAIDHDISLTGKLDSTAFRGHTNFKRVAPELSGEYLPFVVHNAEIFGPPQESGCLYFPAALRNVSGGTSGS